MFLKCHPDAGVNIYGLSSFPGLGISIITVSGHETVLTL